METTNGFFHRYSVSKSGSRCFRRAVRFFILRGLKLSKLWIYLLGLLIVSLLYMVSYATYVVNVAPGLKVTKKKDSTTYATNSHVNISVRSKIIPSNVDNRRRVLNMYGWNSADFCIQSTDNVYWNPLFPNYPSIATMLNSFNDSGWVHGLAIRRFLFYLKPPISGNYTFQINVRDGFDMFLYETRKGEYDDDITVQSKFQPDTKYMEDLRFRTIDAELLSVVSAPFYLKARTTYLVDVIHSIKSEGKMTVLWKLPGCNSFTLINSKQMTPYCWNSSVHVRFPKSPVILQSKQHNLVLADPRRVFYKLPVYQAKDFMLNITNCYYEPSYIIKRKLNLYEGWHRPKEGLSHPNIDPLGQRDVLQESVARNIANKISSILHSNGFSNYQLQRLVFVEQNKEEKRGHRYFVELDYFDQNRNSSIRLSDYFYLPKPNDTLCLPEGYTWQKNVDVYIIVTISGAQHRWAKVMINQMMQIIKVTKDRNFHLIIVDFRTKNINLEKELKASGINYTILSLNERFSKVKGINRAASLVPEDSILFTMDLHLELPLFLLDDIRKSTILGKTVYAPVVLKFYCGEHIEYMPIKTANWVTMGYGMIGSYKKDWDIIGGMNEKMFAHRWGGEDWELVDRILSKKYEIIRRKLPGYYHYYHSRKDSEWYIGNEKYR